MKNPMLISYISFQINNPTSDQTIYSIDFWPEGAIVEYHPNNIFHIVSQSQLKQVHNLISGKISSEKVFVILDNQYINVQNLENTIELSDPYLVVEIIVNHNSDIIQCYLLFDDPQAVSKSFDQETRKIKSRKLRASLEDFLDQIEK